MKSIILGERGPLRWKTQRNGVPKLQGVFTLRDEQGFPVDMAYELARERGWEVDWLEALADAARQCVLKYLALLEEIRLLEPHKLAAVTTLFAAGLMACDGATFQDRAANLYRQMRAGRRSSEK